MANRSRIHHKGNRNRPLTAHQKPVNCLRSKVRVRGGRTDVGSMVNEMKRTRCIGRQRTATRIGLCNLCYNMRRFTFLKSIVASTGRRL